MKNIIFILLFIFSSSILFSQESRPQWQDGKIWIKVKADYPIYQQISLNGESLADPSDLTFKTLAFVEQLAKKYQFTKLSRPFHMAKNYEPLENLYQIDFSDFANTDNILKDFSNIEAIEYVEKVPLYYTSVTVPNDPEYNTTKAWGLYKINAGIAWDYSTGSSAITVAVVDNAIEITHSDLAATIWTNPGEIANNGIDDDGNGYIDDVHGYDVADNDNDPNPPNTSFDHGTHVSGTVGAATDNNNGVASIGYGISVIPVKSTRNSSSPSSVTNGYDGIIYAANSGADVINMSWGGGSYSSTGQNIINYAYNLGCILVAASGNDNVSSPHYPSSFNNVISVASTSSTDAKSSFSNYGTDIDVSAPGSYIYSTLPGNTYGYMSGTSMASPMVAGLCGLMLSLNPALTQSDIQTCLENSCDDIDAQNPSYINQLGAGRINAEASMSCISSTLSWAPQADFIANVTTVSAGGSITFTDQSIYNPTSWNWTFSGGVPATHSGQTPPTINYSTPGAYNVKLVVNNTNGSDSITKTNYITVLAASSCDTLSNTQDGDNIYIYSYASPNGYFGGHNGYSGTGWADKFTNTYPAGTYLHFIDYYFVEGMTNSSTAFVTAFIWDATGAGGSPGTVLASKNILIQEIEDNQTGTGFYPTRVQFNTDIALPLGDFFIGYTLTNAAGDTVVLAANQDISGVSGRSNSIWVYNLTSSGNWEDYTPTYSTAERNFHVYLYATTLPITASISPASATVCAGEAVNLFSSGSTNESYVNWYFNGSPTDTTSIDNPSIIFNVAGTQTQYLVAYNTCGHYDVDSIDIIVNAIPNINITTTADTICPAGTANLTASGASTYSWSPTTGLSNPNISNPLASPATTTSYTVVGSDGTCTGDASITINVDVAPTASFNYTPSSPLCDNVPIQFNGTNSSNASIFSWTLENGSPVLSSLIMPSSIFPAGTHNIKLVVENTCGDKDSITSPITINAAPQPYIGVDTSICTNTPYILDAGSGYSTYTWTGGSSSTNLLTVSSTTAGTIPYSVLVTNASGCEGSDTILVTYVVCTEISSYGDMSISLFPNPAKEYFSILGITEKCEIKIISQDGRLVYQTISEEDLSIDINFLSSGPYFVILSNSKNNKVFKLIVE